MLSTISPRSMPISTKVPNIPQIFSICAPRLGYGVNRSSSMMTPGVPCAPSGFRTFTATQSRSWRGFFKLPFSARLWFFAGILNCVAFGALTPRRATQCLRAF